MIASVVASVLLAASLQQSQEASTTPPVQNIWFVFLTTAPAPPKVDSEELMRRQSAHIQNFTRLHAKGDLIAAGPIQDPDKRKRGIVVLTVPTVEEVHQSFLEDPYISNKHMVVEPTAMSVMYGKFVTKIPDPTKISENRIVWFELTDEWKNMVATLAEDETDASPTLLANAVNAMPSGKTAGLAFFGLAKTAGDIRGVALFKGKDDTKITEFLDALSPVKQKMWKYTKAPQWIAEGVLTTD